MALLSKIEDAPKQYAVWAGMISAIMIIFFLPVTSYNVHISKAHGGWFFILNAIILSIVVILTLSALIIFGFAIYRAIHHLPTPVAGKSRKPEDLDIELEPSSPRPEYDPHAAADPHEVGEGHPDDMSF